MKVGFIGLGIMGNPMAKNLLKGQIKIYVNDVNKDAENELVSAGAVKVDDLKQLGILCDVIILMLPNAAISSAGMILLVTGAGGHLVM